jgi:pimeloyl-ACP methyl ester carboxylesterase
MKKTFVLLCLVIFLSIQNSYSGFRDHARQLIKKFGDDVDELDTKRPFSKICRAKDYAFERHKVLTKDGYWLTMFRILGKKGESAQEALVQSKPAVFMQHGVVDSADTFIMNDEKRAPAFMLANAGYDVWLGNTRGNKYSREHRYLDPDDDDDKEEFFNYSFEEMAEFDIPAFIEHIRRETGKDKIGVLAHSQGATSVLVKMSDDIDWWNERVAVFACLGGVTKLEHTSSQLIKDLANQKYVMSAIKRIGVVELFPSNYLQNKVFSSICTMMPFICDFLIELVADADTLQNNQPRVGVFMGHYPSGSSLKSFEHFAQLILSKSFRRFDYGPIQNQLIYSSPTPPLIPLQHIHNATIIQIVGTHDLLSPEEDNHWLRDQLGSNVVFYKSYPLGHTGFLLAKDMQYMKDVIRELAKVGWK